LLTALALAIRDWAGSRKILINLEGHGREPIIEGIDISRTVGWFTSQFPLLLDMNNGNNPEELSRAIVHVKETLRRVPDKGIDYGILRHLTPNGSSLDPEISFNYLGQFFQENGSGLFEISGKKMGNPMSPEAEMKYLLDVRGITVKGRLRISFVYNRYQYRRVNIERLAGDYKAYLLSIIRHCSRKQEGELTLSDYAASDLDEQEVEDLFEELETNNE
jgi:non-ribosomal peptide synthase protein (TIGR01720 family)